METKLNKSLLLTTIKYSPWFICVGYFISLLLNCCGVNAVILSFLFGVAIIPTIILILFSITLGYCLHHRLPLYYVMVFNGINLWDCYIGIPFANKIMIIIYLLLFAVGILMSVYVKNKNNVNKRNSENNTN